MIIQLHNRDGHPIKEWIDPEHVMHFRAIGRTEDTLVVEVMFVGGWQKAYEITNVDTVRLLAQLVKAKTTCVFFPGVNGSKSTMNEFP